MSAPKPVRVSPAQQRNISAVLDRLVRVLAKGTAPDRELAARLSVQLATARAMRPEEVQLLGDT